VGDAARDVDVQEGPRREPLGQHALGHPRAARAASEKSMRSASAQRHGNARDAEQRALEAPDTVPEYVTSSPTFQPLLMPDTTRSGRP